ncbi:hypothetical protein BDW72DRAFT_196621 [Aspergillus terricola var. indicus]
MDLLPTLAVTLSSDGGITTEDIGFGRVAPHWMVKMTVTYLETPKTAQQRPITFQTPNTHDMSTFSLRYLFNNTWKDARYGPGCMLGVDFGGPTTSQINIAYSGGGFASLAPGESWEKSVSIFEFEWLCPEEGVDVEVVGDAFTLQYTGGVVGWWDYGGRDEHRETTVTVDWMRRIVSSKDSSGRQEEVVFQASNVLEIPWDKKLSR